MMVCNPLSVGLFLLVFSFQAFGDGFSSHQDIQNENLTEDAIQPQLCSGFTDDESKSKQISEIISSLDRIIRHFSRYTDQLIADGLFGLRIAEGMLKNIVQDEDRHKPIHTKIQFLFDRLSKINRLSYEAIAKKKLPYDVQFDKIMREPFDHLWPFKRFQDLKKYVVKGEWYIYHSVNK